MSTVLWFVAIWVVTLGALCVLFSAMKHRERDPFPWEWENANETER